MKGQAPAGGVEYAKEYISSFVGVFVALLVVLNFVQPILGTVGNITTIPVLGVSVIGSLIGAGIVIFLMRALI